MSVNATELDRQLAAVKKAWLAAAEGSPERDQLHQQGQTLRAGGASEAVANLLATGSTEGAGLAYSQQYMGAGYSPESDLAARLQTAGLAGGTATTATTPQTVDLSKLTSAIGGLAGGQVSLPSYQAQAPQQVDLSKLYAAGQTQPVQWGYTPPSTAGLKAGIQGMAPVTTPQPTTPQTFTAQQLQEAINAPQPQAPQAMAPQMSAEQVWQRVGETSQYMQPYVEAQTKAVTAAFNKAMQQVRNQQALRGMQAGGGAMAQQRGMIGDLGTQVGNIQANALVQQLEYAIQTAQLTQAEAETIWNQQMQGASFTQAQQVARAQQLQTALGQQESQRLAEQGLGLNVQQLQQAREQAQLGMQADVLGMETQQGQFGAQLGLQGQQLEIQRQQQLADNLARALGMDITQKQWGQEFTAQQMRDIFNQAATAEQLSQAQRQAAINALTDLTQLEIGQSQFAQQFPLQQAGVTGQYQGQPTLDARQLEASLALQQAGLTGYLGEQPTMAREFGEAELKLAKGQATEATRQFNLKLAEAKAEAGGTTATDPNVMTPPQLTSYLNALNSALEQAQDPLAGDKELAELLRTEIKAVIQRLGGAGGEADLNEFLKGK